MIASEWTKRTAFRLAVTFTALFVLSSVLLFGFLSFGLSRELQNQIRNRVMETSDVLVSVDNESGFDGLIDVIERESQSIRKQDWIFLLVDHKGRFRAGNVRGVAVQRDWLELMGEELNFVANRSDAEDRFVAKWRTVSGGSLMVGTSDKEIRRVNELMIRGWLWGLVGAVALAALAAQQLSSRAEARIQYISRTLAAASDGQLDARVPITRAADDIDHIGEQINATLAQLEKLVSNVRQTSAAIAHDLKKPIGRLQQKLEEARRKAVRPEEFREAIDAALRDLDALVETFEAILNISRISAGAGKEKFGPVNVNELIEDVCEIYQPVAEDSGKVLNVSIQTERPVEIRGDRALLSELLANLIENAIRHCPPKTRIDVSLVAQKGQAVLTVADNGPGIPEDERENVLQSFYRLERARSTPGTGLGLSLAGVIAELHGATLSLNDNAPGLAVRVTFVIGS